MVHELTLASKYLAMNVGELRRKRGMSQAGLAKLAGVPRSTVTYIESGAGNPSLQNLIRVSGALQVRLEELLSRPRASCKLIKRDTIPQQKRAHGKAVIQKLLPDSIPGMEIDRMQIESGAKMGGIPHTQNTKEYLVCIKGKVELAVAGEKFVLEAGDVLAFPGDQPHSYHNLGPGTADCFSVVALTFL